MSRAIVRQRTRSVTNKKRQIILVPTHNQQPIADSIIIQTKSEDDLRQQLKEIAHSVKNGLTPYNGAIVQYYDSTRRQYEVVAFGHMSTTQPTNGGNNEEPTLPRNRGNTNRLHSPYR
jgi:hypothetical protein